MSTGGAAINATMKQIVAASRQGIIRVPNHPTYNLLSVEVTQLQNCSQVFSPERREAIEAVIFEKGLSKSSWGRTDSIFLLTPREDMRDVFIHPIGLG
jgi:hypothetical protein